MNKRTEISIKVDKKTRKEFKHICTYIRESTMAEELRKFINSVIKNAN